MQYKQINIDGHNPSSYPYLVVGRDEDGRYQRMLNAHGRSPSDAIDYAKRNSLDMHQYKRFLVIERIAEDGTTLESRTEWAEDEPEPMTEYQQRFFERMTTGLSKATASKLIGYFLDLEKGYPE